jgi:hypothetical protein
LLIGVVVDGASSWITAVVKRKQEGVAASSFLGRKKKSRMLNSSSTLEAIQKM